MQRFGACVVTVPREWTGVCIAHCATSASSSKHVLTALYFACLIGVLAPIKTTLRLDSLHQPRAPSQVRLLLASVESHVLLSSIILPPSIDRTPRNGLHQMLASGLFVSYQNSRLRRGFNYGQLWPDSLSRSLLLQCSRSTHAKTIGRLNCRCQQAMLSNGLKEWPVTCRGLVKDGERAIVTGNEKPRIVAHRCVIEVSIGKHIESPHSPGHRSNQEQHRGNTVQAIGAKDGEFYVPMYPIWAHWHDLE
jgi:hypothetical protein